MPESEHDRRERLKREIAEDLQKHVDHLLVDIHEESVRALDPENASLTRTMARFASLLAVLSIQADKQTQQGIAQTQQSVQLTRKIVGLTWALVGLTAALLLFTVYLAQDVYFTHQREKETKQNHQEERQPDVRHPF